MRQSTLIFVILALGVASAAAPDWAANWEVPSNQTGRCQLRDRIFIAQRKRTSILNSA